MPRSEQSKLEAETIIRWDDTGEPVTLWTASATVRREWQSYGFPVVEHGSGWQALVAVDRITYKPVKKSEKQA